MVRKIRITDDTDFLTLAVGDILTVEGEDETGYWATDGYEDIRVEKTECELVQDAE